MYKRNAIACIALSIAVHVAAFFGMGKYTTPVPITETGRTVVQLTLAPSVASPAIPAEIHVEQVSQPALPVEQPAAPRVEQPIEPGQPVEPEPHTASPDQDGSLAEEKGTSLDTQPFKAVNPVYPRLSRRRGEEGTATISIEVLSNGKPGNIVIVQSSGYDRLDAAALKAAQQTAFTPAKQSGRNIASTTELSYTFRLTDD